MKAMTPLLTLLAWVACTATCLPAGAADNIREVKFGGYLLRLYPDTDDLATDAISLSINEVGGPDACLDPLRGGRFRIEQKGDCAAVIRAREGDPSQILEEQLYCSSDVMKFAGHTYRIKEVLPRCERFSRPPNGGILHHDLYRFPLVRLVDETGLVWVTDTDEVFYFLQVNRKQRVDVTGSCDAKPFAFRRFETAKKCAAEAGKALAQKACADLGGKASLETLKEEHAPWMCYTEAFAEQFCAVYSLGCKF